MHVTINKLLWFFLLEQYFKIVSENIAISTPICDWMIILWSLYPFGQDILKVIFLIIQIVDIMEVTMK